MRLKVACLLLALCVCAPSLSALSLTDVDVNADVLMIGTYPPSTIYGGPNPALTYLLGASLPLWLNDIFFLEPRLELFGTYYEWTFDYGTAVPTGFEQGGSFFTLGTIISAQAGASFPLSSAVSLGGALGLDVLLRFPVKLATDQTPSLNGQRPALAYFFATGRWFYPESRLFLRWTMSPSITMVVNLRAFFPLFHAWDAAGEPFLDQFMGSAGIGMGFRLGAPKAAPAS